MRTIFNMARLHLRLAFQDRSTLVQAFVVPVILMGVLSVAISEEDVAIPIDVVDQDSSEPSQALIQALRQTTEGQDRAVIVCLYGADDNPNACDLDADADFEDVGQTRLEERDVAATLVIPASFGEAIQNGQGIQIEYRSDEQLNAGTVASNTIQSALTQFNSSLAIAAAGTEAVDAHMGGFENEAARQTDFNRLREEALTEFENPPIVVNTDSAGEAVNIGGSRQSVPGMGSMFVLFSLLLLSVFMIEERRQWTLQRLMTLPTPRANIVLGKITGAFLFGVLQFGVFVLVGILFGVNWGKDPIAVVLLILAYCAAGTALGFLLSTLVRTADQAGGVTTLIGLTLAPLGGAWWPLEIVPDFMRTVGHISPIAWVMDGFKDLLYYQGTVIDVLPEVGVLLLFAAVFTVIAVQRFKYE
jgi:ABC-2 type transport system permease protein